MLTETCRVNQRHLQILDMYLEGKNGTEIAQALGMSNASVSLIIHGPTFQHELALRRAMITEKKDVLTAQQQIKEEDDPVLGELKRGALSAAQRLSLNVKDFNGNVANKACSEILDRAGYGVTKKLDIEQKALHIVVSAKDASLIAETLRMTL